MATRFGHLSKSDHSPIGAKILAKIIIKPTATVWRVDKSILTVNVAKKLKESHWPLKQANRDVVAKQIMHKVATLTYKSHILKRAAAAVANPNISKAEFERVVLQMSKADTELLITDLRQGSAPDPRKFFHIAKHLAGLA